MGISLYRILENITGQYGRKLIPYKLGQRFKMIILIYLIRG
jgi:hypothetical protein